MHITINETMRIHRCEPAWRWNVCAHEDHDLWCVLSGQGEIRVNGTAYPIQPGCCWLFEPGQSCSADHDPNNRLRVFAVHFDPLTSEGRRRSLTAEERPEAGVCVNDLGLLEALVRKCIATQQRSDGTTNSALAEHILQLIHLLMLQSSHQEQGPAVDARISGVYDLILEDPGRPWTVQSMAHEAGLSASQFSRLFRHCLGRSPARCVMEARITRASVLLRESSATISEIAGTLGYRDIYYFSRQFKALTDQSPTSYRDTHRRDDSKIKPL